MTENDLYSGLDEKYRRPIGLAADRITIGDQINEPCRLVRFAEPFSVFLGFLPDGAPVSVGLRFSHPVTPALLHRTAEVLAHLAALPALEDEEPAPAAAGAEGEEGETA